MSIYIDMMDFPVEVVERPMRIVSLVPSLSLLLSDMGLGDRLVGVTKFCVHPEGLRDRTAVVGGTKLLHLDDIRALKPDLIVANKEENNKVDIETLQEEFPVWISDIATVDDSLYAISMLGEILQCQEDAQKIHDLIVGQRKSFSKEIKSNHRRVAYVIWNNPFMAAGSGTFIHHMLEEGGWQNAFDDHERYPAFTLDGLKAMNPDLLFLSSEPFPFKEKHKKLFTDVIAEDRIMIVDGEMFSWYGSRLIDSYKYFKTVHNTLKKSAA